MANTATVNLITGDVYGLYINGKYIVGDTFSRVDAVKQRLNYIFADPNRDLDFITPSYENGQYVISCPRVRRNVGQVTYLYDTNGSDGWKQHPSKLYEPTHWSNSGASTTQTAIMTASGPMPWHNALLTANQIRAAVNPNFASAAGDNPLKALVAPTNTGASVQSVISSSARCDFYGHPCQGTAAGTTSPSCSGYSDLSAYQNISNTTVGNGEVLHPVDLTCAMTSTNSWSSTYRNKYIKVTNLSNNQSIVVRVTDTAPANRGVELTYRAWVGIGKPSGANSVKIELMS
ncbi:septal ring lytic transglycosylase RlpA family protein [Paenibacillus sp. FSL P4-0338]|uniref:septal ring lytic transglycosylase RlpA family protein n=1 Tax=unclassified Paenibacillus TaxID=185978 RepID=UPI0004AE7D3D|nr:septal ring lytic transglycosylase RlpA family protein [Paenibacillus sp. FSL R7-269]